MTDPFDPTTVMDAFAEFADNSKDLDNPRRMLLATVDPAYAGSPALPKITFDGETALTTKTYHYLGQAPNPGSRVLMQPVGSSHIIIGAMDGAAAAAAHTHLAIPNPSNIGYYNAMADFTNTSYAVIGGGPTCSITVSAADNLRTGLVLYDAAMYQLGAAAGVRTAWECYGATVVGVDDAKSIIHNGSGGVEAYGNFDFVILNQGTTTFRMLHYTEAGTGRLWNRRIAVVML